jgi:hypothetical protein
MPRLTKRQKLAKLQRCNGDGGFGSTVTMEDNWDLPTDLTAMTERILTLKTEMAEEDGHYLRAGYIGDSQATKYRRLDVEKKRAADAATCRSLFTLGFTVSNQTVVTSTQEQHSTTAVVESSTQEQLPTTTVEQDEINKIKTVHPDLRKLITPRITAMSTFNKRATYEFCRILAVYHYYGFRLQGYKREKASIKSADLIWNEKATTYRYRSIRKWADEYLETNDLRAHSQGKHGKRESVLSLEDVKLAAMAWISQQPPAK